MGGSKGGIRAARAEADAGGPAGAAPVPGGSRRLPSVLRPRLPEPRGGPINVYLTTQDLKPGGQFLISFSCETGQLAGEERVFVVANAATGQTAFPDGAGYSCAGSPDAGEEVFAFTMPATARLATIWLRATGNGTATFEQVSVRSLQ